MRFRLVSIFWGILTIAFAASVSGQPPEALQRMRAINPSLPGPLQIDAERVAANSIFVSSGEHLTLYTDIRSDPIVNEFPKVFDTAVPQWCRYFDIDPSRAKDWHLRGYAILEKQKFRNAGLMPASLPEFPAAFQTGHEMWIFQQPGNYYFRHLLLHEGTHSFMQWFLNGTGAPWYAEGMAELLGVHRWQNGSLDIGYSLNSSQEADYWGRVKLIKEDLQNGDGKSIDDVFNIPARAFRDVRLYAWSWAACEFFSKHPLASREFDGLKKLAHLESTRFNQHFIDQIAEYRPQLDRDWDLFIGEIDYGYKIAAGAVSKADSNGKNRYNITATRSWQTTDITVKQGDRIAVAARGRFIVNSSASQQWPCEAGGVTIDYYRGQPLGKLVLGILSADGNVSGLFDEYPIGLQRKVQCKQSGNICFRINESPAKLDDNKGSLEVAVKFIDGDERSESGK